LKETETVLTGLGGRSPASFSSWQPARKKAASTAADKPNAELGLGTARRIFIGDFPEISRRDRSKPRMNESKNLLNEITTQRPAWYQARVWSFGRPRP
jgi:hypothetical protein